MIKAIVAFLIIAISVSVGTWYIAQFLERGDF
jgi:hypothetical protein